MATKLAARVGERPARNSASNSARTAHASAKNARPFVVGFASTARRSTHLHGDHVGGLPAFSPERVWVARAEWTPIAAFPGRLMRPLTAPVPMGFVPRLFDFDGPPVHDFPGSWRVTRDGSVLGLPTPGHSAGHTSFLVRRPQGDVLLAGDVTYDLPALEAQRDQGFIAKPEHHRATLRRVLSLVKTGVAYLPSHDPDAPARL